MPRSLLRLRPLALGLLLVGTCAVADDLAKASLPQSVTIQQLLQIAREQSPRVAATRAQIGTARAEIVAAGVLPNPRITYGRYQLLSQKNTMYDGNVQQEYTLEVPVQIAGQRGARVEAAEKRVAKTEAEVEADFAELTRNVWTLFIKLLVGRERVAILEQAAQDLNYLRTLVAGREQAGSASPYDVLRMSVEAQSVETRLDSARADLAATGGELGMLLGFPDWKPDALGTLAPIGIAADSRRLWEEAEHSNPELVAAQRAEQAADAGLEQARRERWPTPSILLGSAFTNRPYGNAFFAGVSVELPLFDRGQGGMARAAAEKQTVLLERDLLRAKTRTELDRAVELLARRRASLDKFEREVLGRLPDLKQMAESAYRLGKGTLLELLDAARSRTDIRLSHVELIQAETEAELDALKASGLLVSTLESGKAQN
ncbi:TolC family protein [Methylococcus sp. EFPC2]|uniref:TolC family protein n=1 Tax=Methylococcus sp. EFPC2 TaxID=2812648 RepID=UPI001F083BD4|nr:TolC family protein [Methylococcus sp. EFPC2]